MVGAEAGMVELGPIVILVLVGGGKDFRFYFKCKV